MKFNNPRRVPAPSMPRNEASNSDNDSEKDGGFVANLSQEDLQALEEKKALFAAKILAKREAEAARRAAAEKEAKKEELQSKKLYVRGNKLCSANRIYEDSVSGWYICEVCDKKFMDVIFAEDHIKTEKHKRNLEWYKDHPLPNDAVAIGETLDQLPEYVRWDEASQYYICELCPAKAACLDILQMHLDGQIHKKKVANQAYWVEQQSLSKAVTSPGAVAASPTALPAYCQYDKLAQTYVCRWCEKKAPSIDMLEVHLIGKEHAKKTSNIGMVAYGHPDHVDHAKAYTDKYGFDPWARRDHWPASIVDDAASGAWMCVPCKKKFLTPSAVNDHLLSHSPKFAEPMLTVSPTRPTRQAPRLEVHISTDVSAGHECALCMLPFNSAAELDHHEKSDPTHAQLLRMMIERPVSPEAAIAASWEPNDNIDL